LGTKKKKIVTGEKRGWKKQQKRGWTRGGTDGE